MAKQDQIQYLDIQRFTGMNTLDEPYILDPSESPYMVNMSLTQDGSIITRFGYQAVCTIAGTGGLNGVLPAYLNSATYTGDQLALFYAGTAYYITNSSSTPVSMGSYGSDRNHMHGQVFKDNLIFGNGHASNTVKKWDGVTLASLAGTPPKASLFAVFNNRLLAGGIIADASRLCWSDPDTIETDLDANFKRVDAGNGEIMTSLVSNNDVLNIFKENSIYSGANDFDQQLAVYDITVQNTINANGGAYGGETTQAARGYTYYLTNKGVETYGSSQDKITGNLPLPLSFKIDPTIQNINMGIRETFTSAYFRNKYIMGIAMGNAVSNTGALVYDENFKRRFGTDNWVYWELPLLGMFCVFRDSRKRDQLYFGSNTTPTLYEFNTSFDDDGAGYTRLWTSKTFRFGERTVWQWIDLEGAKPVGATIYAAVTTDGTTYQGSATNEFKITDADFISGAGGGGYLGDSYLGDVYTGAAFATTELIPMFRWKKRLRIPMDVNYGYEMYFSLQNNAAAEGWKLTRAKLAYSMDADDPTYENAD